MVENIEFLPGLRKSDHLILEFEYIYFSERVISKHVYRKNFFRGNYEAINTKLNNTSWEYLCSGTIDDSWNLFVDILTRLINEHIPVCKESPGLDKTLPYINREIKDALKKKNTAWRKYLYYKTIQNFDNYILFRDKATSVIRNAKYSYEKELASNIKYDCKLFWKYIKFQSKTHCKLGPLKDENGADINDDFCRADLLSRYFGSVFKTDQECRTLPTNKKPTNQLNRITITIEDVKKAIKTLKPNKACGPDNIHAKILIECKDTLAEPLTRIFNKSLSDAKVPTAWKNSIITPIFKSGDKRLPENYRPISISPLYSNIMQKIIKEKLVTHLIDNDLPSPAQFGFTKGKSCQLQLLESLEDWTKSLDHGTDVDVIFYDFKKAFDTFSHSKLILKLELYGITGSILHWIKDFLTNRTQEVVINQVHCSTQKVLSGVPQGSVLGPILFLVFINDLPDLAVTTVRLFADDAKTYSSINTDNDVENLQCTTDKFYDWSIKWDMNFNEKKCKRLHLGKKETNHYFMTTKDLNKIQI